MENAFIAGALAAIVLLASLLGAFATFYAGTGQIVSTVTTGTAPFSVSSTTKVANLNVDFIDGEDSSSFLNNRCLPKVTSASEGTTSWGVTTVCTSCAGWLQTYSASHTGTTTAYIMVEVDGVNSTQMTNVDLITGTTTNPISQYALARYTSSLKLWAREGTSVSGNAVAEIHYCEEF